MFLQYFDGYLRVAFSQGGYGDLNMDLALHGDTTAMVPCWGLGEKGAVRLRTAEDTAIRMEFCASMCPFPRFITWLEAVLCGVQECAFEWDAEGPDGELRWFDSWDSGFLQVSWIGKETIVHKVRLNKAQMVRAFYESFRGFVESDRYDPLQYEELSSSETFALV